MKPMALKWSLLAAMGICFPFLLLLLLSHHGCAGMRHYSTLKAGDLWEMVVAASAVRYPDIEISPIKSLVLSEWASKTIPSIPVDGGTLKNDAPRILLAKLATRRDIKAVNQFLQGIVPWNNSGSEWDVRELWGLNLRYSDALRLGHRGDYDFTETTLVTILFLFGDKPDILYPQTVSHIVDRLLIDKGGNPRSWVPLSLGLVPETENHILMTESTRYLANQWLSTHGCKDRTFNNAENGLEAWIIKYLKSIRDGGFHEFNSIPYQGFTFHALLNLEAFADSSEVAGLARLLLDTANWQYAFGSLGYRRCVPFRRQVDFAFSTDPSGDPQTGMMAVWAEDTPDALPTPVLDRAVKSSFGIIASALPYTLPDASLNFLKRKGQFEYFVRVGHGKNTSPEIYSGGHGFLLSAGGTTPLRLSQIVARPTTLFLDDGASDLRQCFQIPGKGNKIDTWNNTGVAHRFACGNAPVHIPEQYRPVANEGKWMVFKPLPEKDLLLVVYSTDTIGLMALFPGVSNVPDDLLHAVTEGNKEVDLRNHFVFPGSVHRIEYDVNAPRGIWVIVSENGRSVPRDCSTWPRMEGWFPIQGSGQGSLSSRKGK